MQKFWKTIVLAGGAAVLACTPQTQCQQPAQGAASAQGAQPAGPAYTKLAARAPVSYDNRYEIYGGIGLETFQAGQQIPKKMIFGNVEAEGTYWLTRKLGASVDLRAGAGTTDVFPNTDKSRPTVVQYTGMGGVQYRGPRNQFAAITYHALAGASHGIFDETARQDIYIGLYTNRTAFAGALGGSIDFNRSKNLAFRLSPDIFFEHYGTELREFFGLSGGAIYRFGKR